MSSRALVAVSGLLLVVLAGCGGGGGNGGADGGRSKVSFRSYTPFSETQPLLSLSNGSGDRIEYFGENDADGNPRFSQAVMTTANKTVRIFFDPNRAISRIQDETTGEYLLVRTLDNGELYRLYAANGTYRGGYAILRNPDGTVELREEIGRPRLDGQLALNFAGTKAASATLVPVPGAGLGQPIAIPSNLQAFLSTPQPGLKLSIGELMDSIGRQGITAAVISGGMLAAELTGFVTLTPAAVGAAGTLAVLGGAALLVGYLYPAIVNETLDQLDVPGGGDFVERVVNLIGNDIGAVVDEFREQASNIVDTGAPDLGDTSYETDDTVASDPFTAAFEDESGQPLPTTEPAFVDSDVEGFGVDQDSNTYTYTGTVYDSGAVVAEGAGSDGSVTSLNGSLDGAGDFSGSWQNATGSTLNGFGSVTGSDESFGACESIQNAGGEGTFSFAYNLGSADGSSTFYYDAYSIPDAFDVFNGGQRVFTTGGLISGSGGTAFALSNAFVYVNVSAPQSGTAWEFAVSCPD